jgi:peptide/nickel transport system substrate-binding protein
MWRTASPASSRSSRWDRGEAARLILLALFLFGAPAAAGQAEEVDKSMLRLLLWQAPTTLNPHFASGAKDQVASRIVYEPLASFDKEGQLVPFLAAEIPSSTNGTVAADGKAVIWKLKPGVKWSDGQPFTAKDVVFT